MISELGSAAMKKGMEEGLSPSELRGLVSATQESLTDVGIEEAKLNREISNIQTIENAKERRTVAEFNITNDRQDQMDKNEIMADAIAGSIAIFNQMRDAVSTKIRDAKLLQSAENQMVIFAEAISGGTGIDERKLLPAIQMMMGNGTLSEKDGQILLGHMKTIEEQDKKQ